jgi:replication factor C subunit 3/5
MFLIDKYIPKSVEDLTFHKELFEKLCNIAEDESIPHMIFYGPPESGKKTLIHFFLEKIFDQSVHKTSLAPYTITNTGNSSVSEVTVPQSNYHIIIDPSNNNFDRYLIQDVVKQYAQIAPLNVFKTKRSFKMVLINNIDNLSYYAQASLRRTIEKYSKTCRFIMWCRSLSKVIEPLKSRCFGVRVPAPKDEDLFMHIYEMSIRENIKLKMKELHTMIDKSKGQIKTAIRLLEYKKWEIPEKTSYDDTIDQIIKLLMSNDLKTPIQIRALLYNIMITNINGTQIIKSLTNKLMDLELKDDVKYKIISYASFYEHRLILGRREINHLEGFINWTFNLLREARLGKTKPAPKREAPKKEPPKIIRVGVKEGEIKEPPKRRIIIV